MDPIAEAVKKVIDQTSQKILEIVKKEHPLILAELARDIFQSSGQSHGRNWQPNSEATVEGFYGTSSSGKKIKVKGKGFNRRNYETGQLMETLMEPGFLEEDNYIENLPSPKRGSSYGYQAANDFNAPQNRFDDIGKTAQDQEYIEEQLEQKITEGLNG